MCIAVPGRITQIYGSLASVNIMNVDLKVNIELIETPKPGDYVLVHAGFAIEKITLEYFLEVEALFRELD